VDDPPLSQAASCVTLVVRLLLLLVGIATLVALVWRIGPAQITGALAGLGPGSLVLILLPSVLMYGLEAYGWRLTLVAHGGGLNFLRLFAIRAAGEAVNLTTPVGFVAGEPLKAHLLNRHGVDMVPAMASVVTAKTTMTISQVAFMLIGVGVGTWVLSERTSSVEPGILGMALAVSAGLFFFGTGLILLVQRRGLFTAALNVLHRWRIHIRFLDARADKLQALDRAILDFYALNQRAFLLSTGFCFLGWLAEALEVYVMFLCLGLTVTSPAAFAIAALSVFIKGGTFFIPGSVGAQEGGNVLLLMTFGYSDVDGMAFALLRRLREIVWIGIGLICLAALRVPSHAPSRLPNA
jgi:uncharacterized protein (TIRG00374 family)